MEVAAATVTAKVKTSSDPMRAQNTQSSILSQKFIKFTQTREERVLSFSARAPRRDGVGVGVGVISVRREKKRKGKDS